MNENIHFIVEYRVNDGMEKEFAEVRKKLMEMSEAELGTIAYEWYTSDGKNYHFYERYENSDAVVQHLDNFGKIGSDLSRVGIGSILSLYGPASQAVIDLLAIENTQFFSNGTGFSRLDTKG